MSSVRFLWSRGIAAVLVILGCFLTAAFGQEKVLEVDGIPIALREVTGEAQVYFSSMRWNRASNEWNVEVTIRNTGSQTLPSPLVVYIESWSGTSGLLQPDGQDGAKPYYSLSAQTPVFGLAAGASSQPRTLRLGQGAGSPTLDARVFAASTSPQAAVAFAQTLNEAGQPLPEVVVEEHGPDGLRTNVTDSVRGTGTLGQRTGAHLWKFSKNGYLPVWRNLTIDTNSVRVIAGPRLSPRGTNSVVLTPIAGGVLSNLNVALHFGPGSFNQTAAGTLTSLTGQTLPGFLPAGWSPLGAFWFETDSLVQSPGEAQVRPWDRLATSETAVWIRWNEDVAVWEVLEVQPGKGLNPLTFGVSAAGAYALLVADSGSFAPPPAVPGQPLPAAAASNANLAGLSAIGTVTPSLSAASRTPELVTAQAEVSFTNSNGPLPSGLLLQTRIIETYEMADGSFRHTPEYENHIVAYQRPGDSDPATLVARFPMRPLLLLGSEELAQATVHVDVMPPQTFSGAVFDHRGGQLVAGPVRIVSAPSNLLEQTTVRLSLLAQTNLNLLITNAVLGFDLQVGQLPPGKKFSVQFASQTPNSFFVLSRVLSRAGVYGLEPVERFASDATGQLSSLESASTERLLGITGGGQFILARLSAPQGVIRGVVRGAVQQPLAGAVVRVHPWLTFSDAQGQYRILGSTGAVDVVVTDLSTGDSTITSVVLSNPQAGLVADVSAQPQAPRVTMISPSPGSNNVPVVSPIVIHFSEPLKLSTVLPNGIEIIDASNQVVVSSISFNLKGTIAFVLPVQPLAPLTQHAIRLGTNITDVSGVPLAGETSFTFRTATDLLQRELGGQLISYEPTNGVMRIRGTPGMAEGGGPVVLVNETTGYTSTVLAKADGSFDSGIPAEEDDLLSAVFVNANGTRNVIPVSRQVFSDGTVGLFQGGGTIESTNSKGVVQVLVEAGAVPGRTKFKIEALDAQMLPSFVTNVPAGSPKPLGGLKVRLSGDSLVQSMDVSFPINPADLGLPQGESPTNATYALAIPREMFDAESGKTNTVYEIIDRMQYEDGKLVTHSPPFFGLLPALNIDLLTVPLFMSVGHQMTIAGRVYSAEFDNEGKPKPESIRMLPGAVVSAVPPGAPAGIPGRLRPGTVMATAGGTNSSYAMMVVVTEAAPAVVTASHPRFPGVAPVAFVPAMSQAERFSLGNFFKPVDVIFPTRDSEDLSAPTLLFSHAPERPEPGSNGFVRIAATDNASRPALTVSIAEAFSLLGGTNIPNGEIDLVMTNSEDLGAFTRRETWAVSAPEPARVLVQARAVDESGNEVTSAYPIFFGGSEPVATNTIPSPDANDKTGPRVISSIPSRGGLGVAPGQPLVLRFDEPIDRAILADPTIISLMPGNLRGKLRLSEDQLELSLDYPDLKVDTEYTLTVNSGLKDLSGNRLDQDPVAEGNNSFVLTFKSAPLTRSSLPGIVSGGGAVLRGIYAYVLDRNSYSNASVGIYDLSNPTSPRRAAQFQLGGGYPRDLVLIPDYSFKRTTNGAVETKDLLAVVGGYTGQGRSQYLRLIDISKPLQPEWLAGVALSLNPEAVVSRVQWSAPYLGYLQSGSVNSIGVIDLQSLILYEHMTSQEYAGMPEQGFAGVDANNDGDYVDEGDELPLPAKEPVEFAGKIHSFTLENSDAWINDFVLAEHGQFLGVVTDAGKRYSTNGLPTDEIIPPLYRTLYSSGTFPEAELASYVFTNARPKRVSFLNDFPVVDNGLTRIARLALVSIRMNPGEEDGKTNRLVVLDVTLPVDPVRFAEIVIPETAGDSIFSVIRREDGLLLAAAGENSLLIDPSKFRTPHQPGEQHPAIIGIIPGAGDSMRTFDGTLAGYNVVSSEGRNLLVQSTPTLQFVTAPTNFPFAPQTLTNLSRSALRAVLDGMSPVTDLWLSRFRGEPGVVPSTISPPLGITHYYVLAHVPGSAGSTIELSLESLNWGGQPLRKMGFLFPPVHAFSTPALQSLDQVPLADDAPVRSSRAWRLSSDPASPYYNLYLSRPFALIGESISKDELAAVKGEVDRDILWSGAYLRASFDPSMAENEVLRPFVGKVSPEDLVHYPGVEALANSYPADYIQSPNPGPLIGAVTLTDALGALGAHNGELRNEAADMVLPGRRLPIEFRRVMAAQGLYDGPFGRGWDFNYNQRIVELSSRGLAPGARIPQVIRDNPADSELAENRDLMFYTGAGRVVVWRFAGTNAPSEVASDRLVTDVLKWTNKVERYYLPPPGAFNLMFKFKDGRYARLEPDGTQFWYNSSGRLVKIYDRYDKNSLELVYNARGELIRIYDELRRALDIGWWRLPTDPMRRPGIDETTLRPGIAGKICRLKDYSERDVLFYYTEDGLLERREGPLVETAAETGFTGRAVVKYTYSDSSQPGRSGKTLTGVIGGDNIGSPLLATTELGLKGRDTVSKIKVASGELKVDLGQTNTARALSLGNASAKVTNPDQSSTSYKFDPFGRPLETLLSAPNAPEQKTFTEYYPNGLLKSVTHPEGNKIEYVYDSTNPSLRSRANVTRVTKYPGPRGGPTLVATGEYDGWYNLPAGNKTDFRTNTAVITLRLDHRDTERVTMAGQMELFQANEFGQLEKHTSVDGIVREWSFNGDGFVSAFKVGELVTSYSYAPATGVRSDFTKRGLSSSMTDPRNITTSFVYDELNQLVSSTRGEQKTTYAYDSSGNTIEVRTKVDSDRTLIEQRTYDQVGFMRSKTLKNIEVNGVPTDLVTTFEPDGMRRVKRAVFPGGDVHELEYNHVGQVTNYVIGGTYREIYEYDGNGNRISTTIGGATERHVFDGHDRLIQIVSPAGSTNSLGYDGNNNIVWKQSRDSDGTVLSELTAEFDELNRPSRESRLRDDGVSTATYDYDTTLRRVIFTDAMGATVATYSDQYGRVWKEVTPTRTTETQYDGNGNVLKRTVTEGGRTYKEEYVYNDLDQMVEAHDNQGNSTVYTLGLDGRTKVVKDREGHSITNEFTLLGEPSLVQDPNQVSTAFQRSTNRQVSAISDASDHTLKTDFDNLNRVTKVTLPNNEQTVYSNFDALNSPKDVSLPRGIHISTAYNPAGQMTNRVFTGFSGSRAESYKYDGLQRLRLVRDPSGSASFDYDRFGFTKRFGFEYQFQAPVLGVSQITFDVLQTANAGGFRTSLVYPDAAVTVQNSRDETGRLLALLPNSGEPVIKTNVYLGDSLIVGRTLGNNRIQMQAEFDSLRRPIMRRFVSGAGRTLVDLRYAYDKNGAQKVRQYVHRGGRTDFFQYDDGYRFQRVDVDANPSIGPVAGDRSIEGFTVPGLLEGTWSAGPYARKASYSLTDVLQSILTINPDNLDVPPIGAVYESPDELLFVQKIDGFTRVRDEVGNITVTRLFVRIPGNPVPVSVVATNTYNELNQLIRIERADGVVIINEYGPSGLRIRRKVTGDAARCVPSDRASLYDGGNLIEERDLLNGGAVVARYYYGDQGDELIAGDLFNGSGLVRHYFLTDVSRSVLGVSDASGTMVEQVRYDAWGQPQIEAADSMAPQVAQVVRQTNSLLLQFTEPVLPVFEAGASTTNVITSLRQLSSVIELRANGQALSGQLIYEPARAGAPFGSAVRFVSSSPLSGAVVLQIAGGMLQDGSNNTNAPIALNLNVGSEGIVFTGVAVGSTAPQGLDRSGIGSPFLFQGQVFDYETGLLYCRARFYDPASGMFLQRDPSGYIDGVNQYAGFANNPISLRDPTGHATPEGMDQGEEAHGVGNDIARMAKESFDRTMDLGTATAHGIDLLNSGNPGSQGALDAMRGAELIISDVQVAAGAFGTLKMGLTSAVNLTRRAAGFMQRFRGSPQIPQAVREHLIKSGLTQIEIDAIIPAMKKHGVSRLSIRSFKEKRFARQAGVNAGLPQKPVHIKDKTGFDSTITKDGVTYVSDADILHVEVNGRPATLKEVQKFTASANRNYTKLWNQRGLGAIGVPANPPFQHGSHLGMAQMYERGGKVNGQYIGSVGHPDESFTIRIRGDGNVLAYDTPRWKTHQDIMRMGGVLQNRMLAQGVPPLTFPGNNLWPGKNWNNFRKDYVMESLSYFWDPVNNAVDQSKMRRFFGTK